MKEYPKTKYEMIEFLLDIKHDAVSDNHISTADQIQNVIDYLILHLNEENKMKKLFKITGCNVDEYFNDYNGNAPQEILCYCNEDHVEKLTEHFTNFPSGFGGSRKKYENVTSSEIKLTYLFDKK